MISRSKLQAAAVIFGAVTIGAAVWTSGLAKAHADPAAAPAQASPDLPTAAADMTDAAKNFWASLTPDQRAKARFEVDSDQRYDWHFIPRERKGLTIREMAPAQRQLAHALLSSGLSYQGYSRAVTIMSLDQVLHDIENGKGPLRDPENYFFSIFGTAGAKDAWGWRVEGHHLSLNFLIVGGKEIAASPAFFGDNPAKILDGPRAGLRTLGPEEDMGRAFAKSLTEAQQKTCVLPGTAPKDIFTAASRKAQLESLDGAKWTDLTARQREALKALVKLYADRHRGEIAGQDLAKIEQAGWDKVVFAWQGGLEPGEPHYYRIKGPTFLVEYDNTANNANHIHTVWRDLLNDFGDDALAKHYAAEHGAK